VAWSLSETLNMPSCITWSWQW